MHRESTKSRGEKVAVDHHNHLAATMLNNMKKGQKSVKWIEMIQLRAVNCDKNLIESELHKLICDTRKHKNKQIVMAYSRALIDTDYSIQIFHDSTKIENYGSPLGLRIVTALKDFGPVNHSVWHEITGK